MQRAFVANAGLVYVLDLDKNMLVRTVRTGNALPNPLTSPTPAILVVDTRAGHVFVANYANGTVDTFDARSGRPSPLRPRLGLQRSWPWTGGRGRVVVVSDTVMSVLDARSGRLLRAHPLALAPQAVALDEQTGHIRAPRRGARSRRPTGGIGFRVRSAAYCPFSHRRARGCRSPRPGSPCSMDRL